MKYNETTETNLFLFFPRKGIIQLILYTSEATFRDSYDAMDFIRISYVRSH